MLSVGCWFLRKSLPLHNQIVLFSCRRVIRGCAWFAAFLYIARMRSPFRRACIMLALVLSLGLHWTVLQSAAWVGMVVAYSKNATLGEALEKTFDGAHPCPLCKLVEAGEKGGQGKSKQTKAESIKKIDLMIVSVETLVIRKPDAPDHARLVECSERRTEHPPVPPPRAV